MNRPGTILVEISPGELIDKITILELKEDRLRDEAKRRNVTNELTLLKAVHDRSVRVSDELNELTRRLREVNQQLWDIEDRIRVCEQEKSFDDTFVELARSVYKSNDRRSALKREINLLLGSFLVEEKGYSDYG